ncbi:bifunctional diguanylate cyclase/phosphodiesterase [Streptomyces sp. TLI_171]|uniref:putative bifunctional diguanylate cyclase/phosphodiesterase n=1 Tax=Streptomyces sp. TLI_171 TaxID=1938859 RepID=UPI000C19EF93|nr:EAL domain-containing protein [Streptomyces sp. TLI_171]RKE21297.1 PAS domain S-box-containing protein/diguanylate cyclase (GGDEF)-like protein [Streptomyces sp. TLI_171]
MNSTESVPPARSSLRRVAAVLLAVLCAGYAAGAAIGWGSTELALVMGDFGLAGAALVAALSCLGHGIAVGGHTRPAWLLFGLSSAMVAFGNGAWGWYEVVLGKPLPPDSLADYAFLLFAPLAITGLLVLAQRPRTPAGWLCLLLDGWLVAGSLFTLSWSLALGRVAAGDGDDPLKLALGLGYPVLDILLVSLVVGLNFRRRDGNRAAVHTAMIGLALTVVCDALFTTPQFHSDYHSGELLDAGWFAGSVLLAWAPWSHARRPLRQHPSAQGLPRRRVASTFSALTPYAAAAVCTAAILYNALGGRSIDRVMLAAASTVGLALIVRQGVMLLDNLSLAQELATKEAHFRSLVQGSSDVIMIAGPSGALSYVSPAALRVYNRDPEDLVGGNLLNLVHPEDVDRVLAEVRRILARTKGARFSNGEPSARVECRIRSGEGEWLHVESTVNPYRDGLILNSRDITERVRLQAQLQHNAFHDPLTDLPNRALFAHRVRAALSAQGPVGTAVAVLFLDLDGFKAVNDTAGHQVGDELLVQAARRLQAAVRSEDTVARFGGDEFAVLVRGRLGHPQVRDLAERIRGALSEPYWIGGAELGVAASIGIAFGPDTPLPVPEPAPAEHGAEPARPADGPAGSAADELLRNADLAMYQAKSRGKGRVVLYTSAMRAELDRRSELEERLRAAVREGSFTLLHQPVVDLAGGRLTGVEAQARWRSAQGMLLTPAEFLRTAESGDAATRFARWLLTEAVAAAARRRADGPAAPPVPVTVRLAAERLCAPGMYETLAGALRDSGLPPELLVLEVARTGPDALADELGRRLAAFRRLGVSTALAGFGAGGGSLGVLARMPFDALKLDRSLVQDLADSTLTRALAGHALRLGRDLGLVTGADGVDHPRQVAALQELGCRRGQGLAFDRPLDELRLRRALLRRGYPVPRPAQGLGGRRALLAPDPRTGGLAEAAATRPGHPHTALDLPQRHTVGGPGGGPHGETAVPPA